MSCLKCFQTSSQHAPCLFGITASFLIGFFGTGFLHSIYLETYPELSNLFRPGMIEELCKAESDAETRILFIDSTGNECLSNRQMCTIESAAITNPDMTIYVYLHSPDSRNNGTIKKTTRCSKMDDLSEHYTNIHFIRLDLKSLLIGTRLISILVSNNRRQHLERHLSDATRIAALYKYGGIFIDWNAIVLRSLRCLKNALAHHHSEKSSVNVLVFDRGHAFLSTLMNVMKQLFDPEVEGSIGWQAVTSAIRAFCNVGELVNENGQLLTCRENSKLTIPYTAAFNSIASIEKTFLTNESFLEFSLKRLERSFLIDTNVPNPQTHELYYCSLL